MAAKRGESIRAVLGAAAERRELVRIRRARLDPEGVDDVGYVVGLGEGLVMLHQRSSRIDLDGWRVLRLKDVTGAEDDFTKKAFYQRALEMKGERPCDPGVDLADVPS